MCLHLLIWYDILKKKKKEIDVNDKFPHYTNHVIYIAISNFFMVRDSSIWTLLETDNIGE